MRLVLRRIAIHGALTALILGVVGSVFAEMASMWMATSAGTRGAGGPAAAVSDSDEAFPSEVRSRVPLFMAAWGFLFVAVGETLLHLWRGRKPVAPPTPPQPDDTERLLQEILERAESASRRETGDREQETKSPQTAPPASP